MNGSSVTAKIAGIESTANTMSVVSISTSTASSGVATRLPGSTTENRCPWYSGVIGTTRRNSFSTGFRSGCTSSSRCSAMRMPVSTRNAPKT